MSFRTYIPPGRAYGFPCTPPHTIFRKAIAGGNLTSSILKSSVCYNSAKKSEHMKFFKRSLERCGKKEKEKEKGKDQD